MSTADQIHRASAALDRWPFIPAVEDEHGLPRWLLLAVGLRETGLDPAYGSGKRGDSGYGHGPWQLDSHPQNATPARLIACAMIDAGDVQFAAGVAASMLRANFVQHGNDWLAALNVYNSGQTKTEHTAGHDYGPAVLAALGLLQHALGPLPHPAPAPQPQPVPQPDPVHVIRNGESYMQHTVIVTVDRDGNGFEPTDFPYAGSIVQDVANANPRPVEQGGDGRYHIVRAAGLDHGGKLDVVVMGADPSPSDTQRYTIPIPVDVPD